MSTVFFDVTLSLDGFLAGPNAGRDNPLGDRGPSIHAWMFATAKFHELLGGRGGDRGGDDAMVRAVFARAGAYVMGRRMFDEGERPWTDEPPFHAPVFVLTHEAKAPLERRGGTTFEFVTGAAHEALARARAVANGKDVRVCGGADTIRQFLAADLIDEFTVHTAPVLLGAGKRLFDGLGARAFAAEPAVVSHSALAAHATWRVRRDPPAPPPSPSPTRVDTPPTR